MPDQFISLDEAKGLVSTYRETKEKILADNYKNTKVLPTCETFDRAAFDAILALSDCQKVRVYYGMDENNLVKAVVVGVDSNDGDILPADPSSAFESGIIDRSTRCPDDCPPPSLLNS